MELGDGFDTDGLDELTQAAEVDDMVHMEKPSALTDLQTPLREAFVFLKAALEVGDSYTLDLRAIDANPISEYSDPAVVASVLLRKIQLLWVSSLPDQVTTSDIVVGLGAEICRALAQLFPGALKPHIAAGPDPHRPEVRQLADHVAHCGRTVGSLFQDKIVIFDR